MPAPFTAPFRSTVLDSLALACAALLLAAAPAAADDKKKADDGQFDDLFGEAPKKGNLDDLKKATEGVNTDKKNDGLAPKEDDADARGEVKLLTVFAAERIIQDKKRGCQPAKDLKRVVEWTFDSLPAAGVPIQVCVTLASKSGTEMSMSTAILDSRNQRVARGETVVDFRGKGRADSVLEFPAPTFRTPGQHLYLVELNGKEVARVPLFVVKVDADAPAQPKPAATP